MRAGRFLTEKAPKPRSSTLSPCDKRRDDFLQNGVDDVLDIALIQMRIALSYALYQLRLDHAGPLVIGSHE